jgi:5-(carboxyamino)imidazole ribonucleotide synthase
MIPPGSTIGVLGGGQLGRMFALAAARLGYRVRIFAPSGDNPAEQVCDAITTANYDDAEALKKFARACDVVTYEFENVPVLAAETIAALTPVRPGPEWLRVAQDRRREKEFVEAAGAAGAPYRPVEQEGDLEAAAALLPGILKTAQSGYDGKGQRRIGSLEDALSAWNALDRVPCVLESLVPFRMELSVIVAASPSGEVRSFPPVQNIHRNQILAETIAPAPIADHIRDEAMTLAERIACHGQLTGLLAVEMFLLEDGRLLVNEIAPRPHNSGHWSMDACQTDQFEQSVRAICDLPLGNVAILHGARMLNLLGDEVDAWNQFLSEPNARLHLYGKKKARPGRKMGHVTYLLPRKGLA